VMRMTNQILMLAFLQSKQLMDVLQIAYTQLKGGI